MTNREAMEIASKKGFIALYDMGVQDGKREANDRIKPVMEEIATGAVMQAKAEAIEDCIKVVKAYFEKVIDDYQGTDFDEVDQMALVPNAEICKALNKLKE